MSEELRGIRRPKQVGMPMQVGKVHQAARLRGINGPTALMRACCDRGLPISFHAAWNAWNGKPVLTTTSFPISIVLTSEIEVAPEVAEFLATEAS